MQKNTYKTLFCGVLILLIFSITGQAEMKELSLYTVNYSATVPTINGNLQDECWASADKYSPYYVYNKTTPQPGNLKTTLQMLWNERGVYLGISNYDKNISAIKASHTAKDDHNLWRDDCAEIYFDPNANGVGYTKYIINAIGAVADMRRVDAAVFLNEWSASGIETATSQDQNGWYIEAFFPWSDLNGAATSGSIWRFCHIRYAWSSGNFEGVSSSFGGSNSRPENFGFIYFSGQNRPDLQAIAKALNSKVSPPWSLPVNDGLLICDESKADFKSFAELYAQYNLSWASLLTKIEQLPERSDAEIDSFKQKFIKVKEKQGKEPDLALLRQLAGLIDQLDNIYWQLKLKYLINHTKKTGKNL